MAFTFHGQKYHATGKMNCCSVDGNCVTQADGVINADVVLCWRETVCLKEKMRVLRKSCVTLGRNYATLREVAWCTRGCKIWGFVLQRRGYEASREVTWLRRKTVKLLMMQGGRSWHLSARATIATKVFDRHIFAIFVTNASFLRVIANLQI